MIPMGSESCEWPFVGQNKNFGGVSFGIDGDGNYGYYGADGSLVPFKSFDEALHGYGYGVMQWGTKKYSKSYNIPKGVSQAITRDFGLRDKLIG